MADETSFTQCGVCTRHGDKTPKMCRRCAPCQEWICEDCWANPLRRGVAAGKKLGERLTGAIKKVTKRLDKTKKNDLSLQGRNEVDGVYAPRAEVKKRQVR